MTETKRDILVTPESPAVRTTHVGRIPSLDGVRALAVMAVFVAHSGYKPIVLGGFGVTIFFFLSGYLITTLIRGELEKTGRIDLKAFYARRVLRIWPPMYITLGILFVAAWFGLAGLPAPELGPLLSQLFHYANYYQVWGSGQSLPGTDVFWSLAVEEHFYLVWPALYLLLARRFPLHAMVLMLLAICALILTWRLWLVLGCQAPKWRTYVATDTRIDSILFGCILALLCNPHYAKRVPASFAHHIVFVVSCVLLGSTFLVHGVFSDTLKYTLQGVALMPVFYCAVLHSEWPIFRPLNWRPVRFVGDISYSLYLSHHIFLLLLFSLPDMGWLMSVILGGCATTLFSLCMHFGVERPLASIRRRLHAEALPERHRQAIRA